MLECLFVVKVKGGGCFDMFFWYCKVGVVEGFCKIGVIDKVEGNNFGDYWIDIKLGYVQCVGNVVQCNLQVVENQQYQYQIGYVVDQSGIVFKYQCQWMVV